MLCFYSNRFLSIKRQKQFKNNYTRNIINSNSMCKNFILKITKNELMNKAN